MSIEYVKQSAASYLINKNKIGPQKLRQGFGQVKRKKQLAKPVLKRAFETGFMKRAEELGVPYKDAVLFKEAFLDGMMDKIYPQENESLFSLADKIEPSIQHSNHKDLREILGIGGHIASHGVVPGLIGAGAGGLAGYGLTQDDTKKKRNAAYGALTGGLLGFGTGAYHDAKGLGQNTKAEYREGASNELDNAINQFNANQQSNKWFKPDSAPLEQDVERSWNNLNNVDKSKWWEFYSPDRIENKMR